MNFSLTILAFCLILAVFSRSTVSAASEDESWRISKCYAATQTDDLGRIRAAVGHCDIALATDQLSVYERVRTLNNRCWLILTLRMPTQLALDDCTRAIQLDPTFADAYVNRARGLMRNKLFDAAQVDILKALSLEPNSKEALINLSALQLCMENLDAAMHALDRAFELNPQSPEAYNNRGVLYLKTGIYEQAIQDFDMALAMQKDFAPAAFNRGIVLLRRGEYSAARRAFSDAIRFGQQEGRAFLSEASLLKRWAIERERLRISAVRGS